MFDDAGRETHILERITEGMSVIGPDGEHLGEVGAMKMGDPQAATTQGNEPIGGATNLVMTPVLGVTPLSSIGPEPHVPEPRRSQLLRVGFIRVDGGPLSSHHSFFGADEIASVRDGSVVLAPNAVTAETHDTASAGDTTAAHSAQATPVARGATTYSATTTDLPARSAADPARTVPAEPVHVTQPGTTSWMSIESDDVAMERSDSSAGLKALGVGSVVGVALAGGSLWGYRWWRERQKPANRLRRKLHAWRKEAAKRLPDTSALLDHAPDVDLNARTGSGLGAAALALAGMAWLLRDRMSSETAVESVATEALPTARTRMSELTLPDLNPWARMVAAVASVGLGATLAWLARRAAGGRPAYTNRVDSDLVTANPPDR